MAPADQFNVFFQLDDGDWWFNPSERTTDLRRPADFIGVPEPARWPSFEPVSSVSWVAPVANPSARPRGERFLPVAEAAGG